MSLHGEHDIRRRRERAPGRSGRPQRPLLTHLPADADRRFRALVRQRGSSVFRVLREIVLDYLSRISGEDIANEENTNSRQTPGPPSVMAVAGLRQRLDQDTRIAANTARHGGASAQARPQALGAATGRDQPDAIR